MTIDDKEDEVNLDDGNKTPVLDLTKSGTLVNPKSNIIIQKMNEGRSKTDYNRPVYTENYIRSKQNQ